MRADGGLSETFGSRVLKSLYDTGGAFPFRAAGLVLLLACAVLFGAAALRSTEYDENYSVFVTSGIPRPDWPSTVFTRAQVPEPFENRVGAGTISHLIRTTDVHPPLYFWVLGAWRDLTGDGLMALRSLSVISSLGAVLVWMVTAWRAGLPPLIVGVLLTLTYGFNYTGHVARDYAQAHLLIAVAGLAAIEAWRASREKTGKAALWAALAGLAAGLATFTVYLSLFSVAAVLAWLVLAGSGWGGRMRLAFAAGLPFLLLLWADLDFILSQTRVPDQFDPFSLRPALTRLAQLDAAVLLGGLPLYVEGKARAATYVVLALLLAGSALAVVWFWRGLGPTRWFWLSGAVAPSIGLLALGIALNNIPFELRYLAFAAPFAAGLIGGTLAAWARVAPRATSTAFVALLAVQGTSTLGMVLHPATQQPFRSALTAAAPFLGPGTLLLVPFGNDGVGITGSMLREIPPEQPVLVLRLDDAAAAPERASGFRRVVLLGIGERDGFRQAREGLAALRASPTWQSQGTFWTDSRGHFADVFERSPGLAR